MVRVIRGQGSRRIKKAFVLREGTWGVGLGHVPLTRWDDVRCVRAGIQITAVVSMQFFIAREPAYLCEPTLKPSGANVQVQPDWWEGASSICGGNLAGHPASA